MIKMSIISLVAGAVFVVRGIAADGVCILVPVRPQSICISPLCVVGVGAQGLLQLA
jgi:hypothetical protein